MFNNGNRGFIKNLQHALKLCVLNSIHRKHPISYSVFEIVSILLILSSTSTGETSEV